MIDRTFDPRKAVKTLYSAFGSWRILSRELGIDERTLCTVAHGRRKLSRDAENALRRYLRLPPRRCTRIDRMRTEDLRWYVENRR